MVSVCRFRFPFRLLASSIFLIAAGVSCWADDRLPAGLVTTRPEAGRCVESKGKFMVPYRQVIPGTSVALEMVPVPGGEFSIGSPDGEDDRSDDEGPQVTIRIEPFWMGKYEVTWSEYHEFMALYDLFKKLESEGMRIVDKENRIDAITVPTPLYSPSFSYAGDEPPHSRQPAVTMSQYAARQYTKWLSGVTGHQFRLPTESEWEYACRAGSPTAYGFGDDADRLDEHAWYFDNSDDVSHKVGQKKPNAWGLYDMHGNVGELVLDQYSAEHYARLADLGKTTGKTITGLESVNWPKHIFGRVVRGGSWLDDADRVRSAARFATEDWRSEDPNLPKSPWWFTDEEALTVGFRVIRPLRPVATPERHRFWDPDAERLKSAIDNRMEEGRGIYGLVDPDLPAALEKIR